MGKREQPVEFCSRQEVQKVCLKKLENCEKYQSSSTGATGCREFAIGFP
jgi:hypothetical protein